MTTAKERKTAEQQNDPTIEQESGEVIAVSEGPEAGAGDVAPSGHVKVKLAHPLTRKEDFTYLGLDPEGSYGVNDEVTVPKRGAQALINAGMVQVDPEDVEAVKGVLNVEQSATSGNRKK